jgi:hypothetical protein
MVFEELKRRNWPKTRITVRDFFSLSATQEWDKVIGHIAILLLTNGYLSINVLAKSALKGQLSLEQDFYFLVENKDDKAIRRLVEDLEIIERRSSGETLDDVAKHFGLTRERVRQRQHLMKIYGLELDRTELGLGKQAKSRDREIQTTRERIAKVIIDLPGISLTELQSLTSIEIRKIGKLIDPRLRRFVQPKRRSGSNSMSDEQILEAIRDAATWEYPLSGTEFDRLVENGIIDCVSRVRIMQIFGTWLNACDLAGVEGLQPVRSSYDRNWSPNDLWEYLVDFLLSEQSANSVGNYDTWAREKPGDRPSSGTLRNYLGQWSEVLGTAMEMLRADKYRTRFLEHVSRIMDDL